MKKCTKCKVEKELDSFYKNKRGKSGYTSSCASCHNIVNKSWRNNNKEYLKNYKRNHLLSNPDWLKKNKLWYRYGLTLEDYNATLSSQDNKCAICFVVFDTSIRKLTPCVDHCHTSSQARGLLCMSCNTILGLSNERVETLYNAILYLKKYASLKESK